MRFTKGVINMTRDDMLKEITTWTEYVKSQNLPFIGWEIVQSKWDGRIVLELAQKSPQRFGELKKMIPEISNVMLTSSLRSLEELGMVERKQFNEIPPRVEYAVTEKGRDMIPIFYAISEWEKKYLI